MKKALLLSLAFLLLHEYSGAQNAAAGADSLDQILGTYQFVEDKYIISKQDDKLILDFAGQGKTGLTPISKDRFRADRVHPDAFVEIVKDSLGMPNGFRWIQDIGTLKWNRVDDKTSLSTSEKQTVDGGMYAGRYRQQKGGMELVIKEAGSEITLKVAGERSHLKLLPVSAGQLVFKLGNLQMFFNFEKQQNGKFQQILQTRSGAIPFVKIHEANSGPIITHTSNRQNGLTRADTLRGMLTPLRTCYDVLFYKLNIKIDPDNRVVEGSAKIRFKAMQDFDRMQVDLFANMKIEKLSFHNKVIPYTREFNAVFIQLPGIIPKGAVEEIEITYIGQPQVADFSTMTGGFIWYQDKNGNPWIESVCQGAGASLWWPCKDHLSDKPDSMQISITIPTGLNEISNGKLLAKTDLPGNLTRFDWYVSYPITNYNVVVNIGDYVHFTDQFINEKDTLALNYYCLAYNQAKAEKLFQNIKPMLALYEKNYGKYPFAKDGFTAMESLYPMEHQGAVSIGSINNPINSDKFDAKEVTRTMWHEAAHEWWGNSITCSDFADLWIHEAFATYTETLNYEAFGGKEKGLKHLKGEQPQNKEPIIGIYDVNNFHLGDMYSKGALMLHTLRSVLANDSLFFTMLKELQAHFKYQSVTTKMIVNYINEKSKHDFTSFFDQYLKFANIPELEIKFVKEDISGWLVQYRWNADVKGFNMPVKVSTDRNKWEFIYPNTDWQQLHLKNLKPDDFKIDTDNYYITVKRN